MWAQRDWRCLQHWSHCLSADAGEPMQGSINATGSIGLCCLSHCIIGLLFQDYIQLVVLMCASCRHIDSLHVRVKIIKVI